MKIAALLCAIGMCAPPALEAASAERGPAESSGQPPAASRGQAAGGISSGRDTSARVGRADTPGSTRVGSEKAAGSKGAAAAPSVSPRRGTILPPRGRAAKPYPSPAVRTNRAEAPGSAAAWTRGVRGASPTGLPTLSAANNAARVPPSSKPAPRGSLIGAPHPADAARLGGPARSANKLALDGTQMRRKF